MGDGTYTYVGTRGTVSSTNVAGKNNPILTKAVLNQGEEVAYAHNISM